MPSPKPQQPSLLDLVASDVASDVKSEEHSKSTAEPGSDKAEEGTRMTPESTQESVAENARDSVGNDAGAPKESQVANPIRERMDALVRFLEYHNHLYHTLDAPEISDEEYDALFAELVALEEQHPEFRSPHSPTLRVGGGLLTGLATRRHTSRMYGLEDVFSVEEWRGFVQRMTRALPETPMEFWCDPKLDGLALELIYVDGVLQDAITRGNGEEGEVVLEQARTIRTIPLRLAGQGPFPARPGCGRGGCGTQENAPKRPCARGWGLRQGFRPRSWRFRRLLPQFFQTGFVASLG